MFRAINIKCAIGVSKSKHKYLKVMNGEKSGLLFLIDKNVDLNDLQDDTGFHANITFAIWKKYDKETKISDYSFICQALEVAEQKQQAPSSQEVGEINWEH